MYVPPLFKAEELQAVEFALKRGFGTLVAVVDGRPIAAHIPFVRVGKDKSLILQCHVARANPIHHVIASAPEVLLTVMGPDAYISPDWYLAEDQVPTWNYVSVHLAGTAKLIDHTETRTHVDAVSARFEAELLPKRPWLTTKMTDKRLAAMLNAIVTIEIAVTSVDGAWKLSQNKSRGDRIAVAQMLEWRGDWGARGVAQLINEGLRAETKQEGK